MTSEKKPPLLPRGDSAAPVSARDASFWLALASAPSSSRSGASSEAGSFLWSLRGHTILPDQPAETEAAPLTSPPASLASLYDSELFVPTRLGVPRSSRGFTSSSSSSRELRSKKSSSAAAKRPPVVETEEVYEHQRYQLLLGWGAKGHLLPLDPDKYMRVVQRVVRRRHRSREEEEDAEDGETRLEWLPSVTFPDIALPDVRHTTAANAVKQRSRSATTASRVAHVLDNRNGGSSTSGSNCRRSSTPSAPRWEWVSPWHLELSVASSKGDEDGWQYASSFSQLSPRPSFRSRGSTAPPPPSASQNDLLVAPASNGKRMRVRRRKWVRYRRLRSGRAHAASSASSNAFDDAFLDSMSGWLRKRGHVRKNWKARYFVLEKSVLRYYADAARTKLKGEVLLFHPQTRVHYVDVHVAGGRDASFAVQVGPDYTLLLQAAELRDRENWMYCIEDALLCRDSYHPQTLDTQLGPFFDLRESVAQRRLLSAEAMALDGGGGSFRENLGGISHAHGGGVSDDDSEEEDDTQQQVAEASTAPRRRGRRGGSDVLRLWASLHAKPGGVLSAVSSASPTLRSLLRACDQFLASPAMRQHIAGFLLMFRQKYETSVAASASASAWTRLSEPWVTSGAVDIESDSDQELRNGSLGASPQELQPVTTLQDARSLLALKNYRFFLERSLERVVDYLAAVTDPNTPRALGDTASNGKRAPTDDEWALARRAALYKLERRTFIPLQEVMYQLLAPGGQRQEEEERFERLRMLVGAQSQSFLEIPPSHQSPSEWQSAVALLNSMDNYSLPSEKAAVLVEVARCIYETHAREHGAKNRSSEEAGGAAKLHTPMAADDFLPIFIFVLARCRLRSVIVARHLISETMITALMIGETGYYATMLEAAIGYVAACDAAMLVGELAGRGSGSGSTAVSGC